MNFVFLTHYFPPEGNAPASRTYEHCKRWVAAGNNVTVITSAPNVPNGIVYDGYKNRLWPQHEVIDGINVYRVWTYVAANAGGTKRILNYVSYLFSAVLCFLFFCRRPQLLVATSPQFFCGWAGTICSWLKWCPFLLEIRDIWPESIVTVGAMKKGTLTSILEVMEKWMYRSATHIVTVGNGYKDNVLSKVDVGDRISVVTNGVDLDAFQPMPKSDEFLNRHELTGRFVCSYVGTIGLAHGLSVVIRAALKLKELNRTDIAFCLVGDGASRKSLEAQAKEQGVEDWICFVGRLPKSDMPMVLASSDCLLIHLKKTDLFATVIPSKIFEAMAMKRPLIMGVQGESATIVQQSKSGIGIESDNAQDLVDAVIRLKDDPSFHQQLCSNGRDFVAEHYTRDRLAGKMLDTMAQVVGLQSSSVESSPNNDAV